MDQPEYTSSIRAFSHDSLSLESLPPAQTLLELPLPPQVLADPFLEWLYKTTMDFRLVFLFPLVYVIIVTHFSNKIKAQLKNSTGTRTITSSNKRLFTNEESMSTWFKWLVILHNVFLAMFSLFVFVNMSMVTINHFVFFGICKSSVCDQKSHWFNTGLQFWSWVFYVSKYYEVLDTVILLAKGKPSSFLQTYHHSGSIITMWLLTVTQLPAVWIFVILNSAIHTVMYTYYTLTCFGIRPAWKSLLTYMQITQFVVGNSIGMYYVYTADCVREDGRTLIVLASNAIIGGHGSTIRKLLLLLNPIFFLDQYGNVLISLRTFRKIGGYFTIGFVASLVGLFIDFVKKTYGNARKDDKVNKRRPVVTITASRKIK